MRLSESLRRNIMGVSVGAILNKFKGKIRRNVLFFEDILANYIKECENSNYAKKIEFIAQQWGVLTARELAPRTIRYLPIPFLFNLILRKVWINIGLVDDLHFSKENNIVKIETKNESITRIIGKNNFAIGCYTGILNTLFDSKVKCIKSSQNKKSSKYIFELINGRVDIKGKSKEKYNRLNYLPDIREFTLKDSIRKKIFQLEKNRIYFRKRSLCNSENTIFHLISNENILLEKVSDISYNYFKGIIEKESSTDRKLILLRTLLQTMGWGIVKILTRNSNKITIEIKNPPYGIQEERDNWNFIIRTILGYLWVLERNIKVTDVYDSYKYLRIIYSKK